MSFTSKAMKEPGDRLLTRAAQKLAYVSTATYREATARERSRQTAFQHPASNRREFLIGGISAVVASSLMASQLPVLDVAYAGSMGSMMEGAVKPALAANLQLEMHGRAQGSNALARLIAGGSIRPDIFLPITAGPMVTVLRAGKAESAIPVAQTEMVIAYSPKSRFAARFAAASKGQEEWWEILQEPGLRFGRTDPATDPQGRNIIFTMMLAAKKYKQSDLVDKVLGSTNNPQQIFQEQTIQARLQSGELDAASAYKIQPEPFHLPYITLPAGINLSGQNVHAENPDITLTIGAKKYTPEPLIYYAAILKDAPNPSGAAAFKKWLTGSDAQAIFHRFNYDPPGDAPTLHA
jgi:molybdate/tungstate transport system substrate-binding protein